MLENPKTVKFEKTTTDVVNFRRCELVVELVEETLAFRERPYTIATTEPLHTFLQHVTVVPSYVRDKLVSYWNKLFALN